MSFTKKNFVGSGKGDLVLNSRQGAGDVHGKEKGPERVVNQGAERSKHRNPGDRDENLSDVVDSGQSRETISCCRRKLPPVRALVSVAACVLVQFTLGISYSFGNLMPYLTSYIRNATGDTSLDYARTLWINTGGTLAGCVGGVVAGLIEPHVPNRLFLLAACAIFGVSFFATAWAVKTSFALVVVFFGMLGTVGDAILYAGCGSIPLQWFSKRRGLVTGIVTAGYGGGAFLWNQVITLWINPNNLQPDLQDGEDVYFTQPEVLDKVPSCFLLLGGVLSGTQLVCLLALSYPPSDEKHDLTLTVPLPDESPEELTESECEEQLKVGRSSSDDNTSESDSPELSDFHTPDLSPSETLRSRAAWTLWIFYLATQVALIFIISYYKAYGQTFIHDDHLLSVVGSFGALFNCIGRPFWGSLTDRFGFQPCIMFCQAIIVFTAATFLLSEYAGAAMFFAWICLMYFAISGIYGVSPAMLFSLFGGRHYFFHVGFQGTTAVFSTLISVFVAEKAKDDVGWHGIFLIGTAFAFTGILLNASLLLDCGHPIPDYMKRRLFVSRR